MLDNWLWSAKPFDKGRAWIDLLFMANFKDKKLLFNGDITIVKRGQKITSLAKLSDRWGWSKTKVKKFLDCLQEEEMLHYKSDNKKTVVTIVNYDMYQLCDTQKEHKKDIGNTHKESKDKRKKEKDIYAQQVEQIWGMYPKKKGKAIAVKKIPGLVSKYGLEEVISFTQAYANDCKGKEQQFIQYGSTFYTSGYIDYVGEHGKNNGYYYIEDPETGEQIRVKR